MPLHHLAVSPADVSGSGLRLALNTPAPPPLATLELDHPDGGRIVLGVLGASHVITVSGLESTFSEEISCTAQGHTDALPDTAEGPGYHLESQTEHHKEACFRDMASTLREQCSQQVDWLGCSFPGDDAALTVLAAFPDGTGWHWRTWHLYPDSTGGTVVRTSSRWHP